jgi:hypothetical protein
MLKRLKCDKEFLLFLSFFNPKCFHEVNRPLPQYLQTIASSFMISAQYGHFFVIPFDSLGGSTSITIINKGTIAHNKNHKIWLWPLLRAIILPTIPATINNIRNRYM